MTGFGIPNVGKAAAKAVMKHFGTIERLAQAQTEELTEVPDIGEVSAGCISFTAYRMNKDGTITRYEYKPKASVAKKIEAKCSANLKKPL